MNSEKMEKKAAVILLYFGRWPDYWPLLIHSMRKNSDYDFIIIADTPPDIGISTNIKTLCMSFHELREIFKERVDCKIRLNTPYKICDFRPLFGEVFSEFLKDYRFWGYCDNDIVFGDLSSFLTDEVLDSHDRIFSRGCFSLYRNTAEINSLYKKELVDVDWRQAVYRLEPQYFDEWGGIHKISQAAGIKTYLEEVILDVSPAKFRFERTRGPSSIAETMFYREGKIFLHQINKDPVELALIHMQKRKIRYNVIDPSDSNYIYFTPFGIIEKNELLQSLEEMNRVNNPSNIESIAWKLSNGRRRFYNLKRKLKNLISDMLTT